MLLPCPTFTSLEEWTIWRLTIYRPRLLSPPSCREALRYGKYVIGSAEAFEGIPILNYPGAGCECHNTSDYISLINSLKVAKNNEASRRLFDEQFSTATQLKRFSEFIMSTEQ